MGHWHIGNYMDDLKPIRLYKLKAQATFLLKELKSSSANSHQAANRFLRVPFFSGKTSDWIINHTGSVQLKHAYYVIAIEAGFKTWAELKHTVVENDCLYKPGCVGFIHAWFKNYQQAEIYFRKHGGYLISFWKDIVVCGEEYISCIGLGEYKEQWKNIGYNWVKPKDGKAFQFLKETAAKNYEAS